MNERLHMSKLEKKWWFVATISFLATLFTIALMQSAGVWPVNGFAQWLVFFMCFAGCWRCLSFLGGLIVVLVSPKSKALDEGPC